MMNSPPRKKDEEAQQAIDEFLAKGGKIQQCKPFERTETLDFKSGFYGRKKKKSQDPQDEC